jgi:membrane protease YdiL (CAAX protease family)
LRTQAAICGRGRRLWTEIGGILTTDHNQHLSIHQQQTYWGYEDIGLFFFSALFLGLLLHSAVRLHLLRPAALSQPTLTLQVGALIFLMACLYTILKLRYRRHVWRALGWTRLRPKYAGLAVVGGAILAFPVVVFVHAAKWSMPPIRFWDLVLLGTLLGPALEESFFRGCLLPVLARTVGVRRAVVASALLFTLLHKPPAPAQWVFFSMTGVAYGWMRVSSGSTTAATLMHAAYNATLFACQVFGAC